MPQKILFAWIGKADRGAPVSVETEGPGPIARALDEAQHVLGFCFDRAYLLDDWDDAASNTYIEWLKKRRCSDNKVIQPCPVAKEEGWNPNYFLAVWRSLRKALGSIHLESDAERFYLTSSGTQAMGTIWVLTSRTKPYEGTLLQTSPQKGLERIELPVELAFDYGTPLAVMKGTPVIDAMRGEVFAGRFVAVGPKMEALVKLAKRYAPLDEPVLLLGENGTGKEEFAKLIHKESGRSKEPFKAINCGALPSEMVESELFGHNRGAFTGAQNPHVGLFEAAGKGTVFLDEIGDLPLPQQVKLLRALQEKQIRPVGGNTDRSIQCRFIAATNKSLHDEIANKRFREDLYYRIAGLFIKIPPLRDHEDKDFKALIEIKWKEITEKSNGIAGRILSEDAFRYLRDHNWPGNIRELIQTLTRAAINATHEIVSAADIEASLDRRTAMFEGGLDDDAIALDIGDGLDLDESLSKVERVLLRLALLKANGNQAQAGRLLNLSRATYRNRLNKLKSE